MSAERHALQAALDFSKQLEHKLEEKQRHIDLLRAERGRLMCQLSDVKDAVRERDRPATKSPTTPHGEAMCNEASMPQQAGSCDEYEKKDPYNRCKNCGAIV